MLGIKYVLYDYLIMLVLVVLVDSYDGGDGGGVVVVVIVMENLTETRKQLPRSNERTGDKTEVLP